MATGTSAVTGIAQRNAGVRATFEPGIVARAAVARGVGTARPPSVVTVIPAVSKPTTTDPSRSVRSTRAPDVASRSSVALAGCPYGFPAPADATANAGRTVSMNACVVAVRLPWCATLRRST